MVEGQIIFSDKITMGIVKYIGSNINLIVQVLQLILQLTHSYYPLNMIINLSYFQFHDLFRRNTDKLQFIFILKKKKMKRKSKQVLKID